MVSDDRGFFAREWCQNEYKDRGLNTNVVQSSISFNRKKLTLRGMHYQIHPYEETKVVRCTRGSIFDVIIDLRPDSETYKQWISIELNEDNCRMLYIPDNFAHGFLTLADNTEVNYKITQFYTPAAARGIRWDDRAFKIFWPYTPEVISEKDKGYPDFNSDF
jgi:dTDP-4-dehydrorhamnose 3,5-epimerase